MAWVAGFAHRFNAPQANPTTAGTRALDAIPFPVDILRAQGRIVNANFADVWISTSPGEVFGGSWRFDSAFALPCRVAGNAVYADWTMVAGRTPLYLFCGRADTTAPAALVFFTTARSAAGVL